MPPSYICKDVVKLLYRYFPDFEIILLTFRSLEVWYLMTIIKWTIMHIKPQTPFCNIERTHSPNEDSPPVTCDSIKLSVLRRLSFCTKVNYCRLLFNSFSGLSFFLYLLAEFEWEKCWNSHCIDQLVAQLAKLGIKSVPSYTINAAM